MEHEDSRDREQDMGKGRDRIGISSLTSRYYRELERRKLDGLLDE